MDRKLPLALTMMMSGIFMVIPTPDELLIHPFIGFVYTRIFRIDLKTGIIWSIVSYNILGCLIIFLSIIIGGRCVITELNTQLDQQGKKLGDQIKYCLRTSSEPLSYTVYNNGTDMLADLKFELFD